MNRSDVRARLDHILDVIDWSERLLEGKSLVEFRADRPVRDAVERNLERLSEASRYIPDAMKADHPQTDWPAIARLGNILRHAYDVVEAEIIWNIVRNDRPALRTVATAMLANLPEED